MKVHFLLGISEDQVVNKGGGYGGRANRWITEDTREMRGVATKGTKLNEGVTSEQETMESAEARSPAGNLDCSWCSREVAIDDGKVGRLF